MSNIIWQSFAVNNYPSLVALRNQQFKAQFVVFRSRQFPKVK